MAQPSFPISGKSPPDSTEEALQRAREQEKLVQKAWGKCVHGYVRWAVVGGMQGPEGSETMEMLGRGECLKRFEVAKVAVLENVEKVEGVEAGEQ